VVVEKALLEERIPPLERYAAVAEMTMRCASTSCASLRHDRVALYLKVFNELFHC
jgi:hypothetical protein